MATASEVMAPLAALAGENEAVLGANNTTVNKYFNAVGQPYCGYAVWYAVKKSGSDILDGCSNPAYVPTVRAFLEAKGWQVSYDQPQAGDIFTYQDDHMGFVYEKLSGSTVITLEGNATVYATLAEARASAAGTGAFEGIGYKKRTLTSAYGLFRPAYSGGGVSNADQVKAFQTWLGVDADGITGPATRQAAAKAMLRAYLTKYPIRWGSFGDTVRVVQGLLYAAGYDPKSMDGAYGADTYAAVKAFQRGRGLEADGIAGVDTVAALLGWT